MSRDPFALAPEGVPATEQTRPDPPDFTSHPPLGVGMHHDVPAERYHSDPCARVSLSASIAHTLVTQSPAHARDEHPRLRRPNSLAREKEPTHECDFGSLVDAILLGGGREISEVAADDWRTKAAQTERKDARARGLIPVLSRELERAQRMAEHIERQFPMPPIRQATLVWEQSADDAVSAPVLCRGRPDAIDGSTAMIVDLKMWSSAEPSFVDRHMVEMGAALQAEAYISAVEALYPQLAGRCEFIDLVVEQSTGYVLPVRYSGSMAQLGHLQWQRALRRWTHCIETNRWPSYNDGETYYPQCPPWALQREMERTYGAV